MTPLEQSQHDLLLRCRVILTEIVEENQPLTVAMEQAILEEME